MTALKKQARITGIFYLLLALIAPFSLMYVPSKLFAGDDLSALAMNIANNQFLFRLGIAGETLIFLIEIVVVVLLYRLFESVNKSLSLIAAGSRLAMAVIQGINLFFYLFVLELVNHPNYAETFGSDQTNTFISFLIQGHTLGVYIWQIFFGFHLILLGYLAAKSGYLPKLIGVLLMIASLGYLVDSYGNILFPASPAAANIASILLVFSTAGELVFTFWLLIKGLTPQKTEPVE